MADESTHSEPDIWASPSQNAPSEPPSRTPKTPTTATNRHADIVSHEADREAVLQKELEGVRAINKSIEGILATLNRTSGNMEVVTQTVANASTLLNTWTRILSQTEHNQRLILHTNWKGATEDLAEQEAERQQAAERKAAKEGERREELRRRREEDDEKRRMGPSAASRGTRASPRNRGPGGRGVTSSRRGSTSNGRMGAWSGGLGGSSSTCRGIGTARGRSRPPR